MEQVVGKFSGNLVKSSTFRFTSVSNNGTVSEKRYNKAGENFVEAGGRTLGDAGGQPGLWFQLGIEDEEEYMKERARLYPEWFGDFEDDLGEDEYDAEYYEK